MKTTFLFIASALLAGCDDGARSAEVPSAVQAVNGVTSTQSTTAASATLPTATAASTVPQLPDDLLVRPVIIDYPAGAKLSLPDDTWKARLTAERYRVMFKDGTEPPFQNELNANKRAGTYICAASGQALFRSEDKYDSGTGWPSFTRPVAPDRVVLIDGSKDHAGYGRVEVRSAVSDTHLGHLFDDGPAPTGKRYCMNSAAFLFVPD